MQKVALITGASRGLGQLLARFLAAQNFDLILTARGETALIAAAAELQHFPGKLTLLAGDVSDGTHQQQLTEAVAQHGRLDLLINNASILGPTPLPTLATYPPEALEQVLAVNVARRLSGDQSGEPRPTSVGGCAGPHLGPTRQPRRHE